MILTALLTFQDQNDDYHTPEPSAASTPALSRQVSTPNAPLIVMSPPRPPPKPEPKKGVDRIAEMQAIWGDFNEVTVEDEGGVNDYAAYCSGLLEVCTQMNGSLIWVLQVLRKRTKPCYSSRLNRLPQNRSRKFSRSSNKRSGYDTKQVGFFAHNATVLII